MKNAWNGKLQDVGNRVALKIVTKIDTKFYLIRTGNVSFRTTKYRRCQNNNRGFMCISL